MRYLLDTHILLWALQNNPKLSKQAKDIITNPNNELWFSSASIWEVAIKLSSGKVKDDELIDPDLLYQTLLQENYQELTINGTHSSEVGRLPFIHRDPFDRMLIAQAKTERFILMTADDKIKQYDDVTILMI